MESTSIGLPLEELLAFAASNVTSAFSKLDECPPPLLMNASLGSLTTGSPGGEGGLAEDLLGANSTCLPPAPKLTQTAVIKATILCVMALFSFVGNVATMISIKRKKRHRAAHVYTLIYHLSVADLSVTFWCIVGEALWLLTVDWRLGNAECKIFKFAQMFSLYLSTFIMVLIGVDRFISVKYPMKCMSKGLCVRLVALCWTLSAILSLPQTVIFHVSKGPFVEPFYQCVTHGTYTDKWQEQLYTTFTLVFMFLLPLVILVATYLKTITTLHRNEEFVDHSGSCRTLIDPNRRKIIRRAKMKSLRISVAIVITFLFCWTPYYVLMIVSIFINDDVEDLATAIFFFGMSNSLFNPAIYGIFHLYKPKKKEFQRGSSSKKTLLTNVSIQRGRSATIAARTTSNHLPGDINGRHQQSIRMNSVTTTTEVNGNIALNKKSPNGHHHVVIPYLSSSSSSEPTKEELAQTTAI